MVDTATFIEESNGIERIHRSPKPEEIEEHDRFINIDIVTIEEIEKFVSVYQPDAKLRRKPGMDVRVGAHIPPRGGQLVVSRLRNLLENINDLTPFKAHIIYETLHPFTDCNGRSGRALWAWQMNKLYGGSVFGFLHEYYYQSLDASRLLLKY